MENEWICRATTTNMYHRNPYGSPWKQYFKLFSLYIFLNTLILYTYSNILILYTNSNFIICQLQSRAYLPSLHGGIFFVCFVGEEEGADVTEVPNDGVEERHVTEDDQTEYVILHGANLVPSDRSEPEEGGEEAQAPEVLPQQGLRK